MKDQKEFDHTRFHEDRDSDKEMYVICHCDLDGYASAYAVRRKYPQAIVIPTNHGYNFPVERVAFGAMVIVVDFSYPIHVMKRLNEEYDFIWIDHHDKIMTQAAEAGFNPKGVRSSTAAACVSTWYYFNHEEELPYVYTLIDDHDRWLHMFDESMDFVTGIERYPYNVGDADTIWEKLISDPLFVSDVIASGKLVNEFLKTRNSKLADRLAAPFELKITNKTNGVVAEYKVIAANIRGVNSTIFDTVPDIDSYDVLCTYGYAPKLDIVRYSIYSNKNSSADVGHIAELLSSNFKDLIPSGGGHVGAAGFTVNSDPLFIEDQRLESDKYTVETFRSEPAATDYTCDQLAECELKNAQSVIRQHVIKSLKITMITGAYQRDLVMGDLKYNCMYCNTPYMIADVWEIMPTYNAQLGIAYTLDKHGRYNMAITNLSTVNMYTLKEEVDRYVQNHPELYTGMTPESTRISDDGQTLWCISPSMLTVLQPQ